VGFEINNSDNIHISKGSSRESSDSRLIFASELIRRCLNRPTDEVAWLEFIRRFTPTIRTTVEKTFQLKEREGENRIKHNDEMIEAVVQIVYSKLIENRCKALSAIDGANVKPFLQMVSINAALDYLRSAKPA
jgi:hypothetical protein